MRQVEAEPIKDTLDVDSVKLSRTDTTVDGVLKLKQGTELRYGTNVYTCVFESADENYEAIEKNVTITVLDTIAPTASYKLGVDNGKRFVNALTFGEFCKDYLTVEISYSDKAADGETDGSGVAKRQYYVSDKIIDRPETMVTEEQWKDYDGVFNLDADGTYFIYVRVADNAGNEVILNSEGVVIYEESSVNPEKLEYSYKENRDCTINVTLNGNTLDRLTDDSGKAGWQVIEDQIEKAADGDTVSVDMNGTTTVPSDIFEKVKGRDVSVSFDMGNGATWTVNGKSVEDIKGERYSVNLTLAYSGEFGFTAVLTILHTRLGLHYSHKRQGDERC